MKVVGASSRGGLSAFRLLAVCTLCSTGAALALLALASSPQPYVRPGITLRASVASDATQSDGDSDVPSISSDGRFVAFSSAGSTLVPADTNQRIDVFVRDTVAGTTERISVASDGAEALPTAAQYGARLADITPDGRYVTFTSDAPNLVPNHTNLCGGSPCPEIYVHDRVTGTTERVSLASGRIQVHGPSLLSTISDDGRYVAFMSNAADVVAGDTNFASDEFVHDRETGLTERVSVASDGTQAIGGAGGIPRISGDARYVAFTSTAANLVSGDTNAAADVFVHDRVTHVTERVSVAGDEQEANAGSSLGGISADGRYVAFSSSATNLVPADTNGGVCMPPQCAQRDAFVRDRLAGTTERVSVASSGVEQLLGYGLSGTPGNLFYGSTYDPAISDDGRYVGFYDENGLVPGDTPQPPDIYVHDRVLGITERVSVTTAGEAADWISIYVPSLSAHGRHAAFESFASNLVSDDTHDCNTEPCKDIFVRDRGPELGVLEEQTSVSNCKVMVSGRATFSGKSIAAAIDPIGDGSAVAAQEGAELSGADISYRPELADLLMRLKMVDAPPAARPGAPGVVYGFRFTVSGMQYEVRASREGNAGVFALYRCSGATCTQAATLSGGIGVTGWDVRVSVPLEALAVAEGTALTTISGFSGLGSTETGAGASLDDLTLPNTQIPFSLVFLGVAAAGVPEDKVVVSTPAMRTNGNFTGALNVFGLVAGAYQVWAKACLGETCGPPTAVPVQISTQTCSAFPPVMRVLSRKAHAGTEAFDIDLPLSGAPGIECRSGGPSEAHQIVFKFAAAITFVSASVAPAAGHTAELDGLPTLSGDGKEVTVNAKNVSDGQSMTVSLLSVSDGTDNSDIPVQMIIMAGDTNADTRVNVGDTAETKSNSGSLTNAENFRTDVNLDGRVNVGDVSFVKAHAGSPESGRAARAR